MISIVVLASMIFGYGSWECVHEYQYPRDNIKETFISRVVNHRDLTYNADEKLIYRKLDSGEILVEASIHEIGSIELSEQTFSIYPGKYDVSVDFDNIGIFTDEYISYIRDSGLKPGHGLMIDKLTETEMIIRHIESSDLTRCLSLGAQ